MSVPSITEMLVVPVAGRDSMLLNLSGAHGPFFTRNLVILTDNAGHTGVGEVPGGEKIRQTLEDARDSGRRPADRRPLRILQRREARSPTAIPGVAACRPSTCAWRSTRSRRSKSALLDLLGQHLGVPVAALLGEGQQRDKVEMLGYLFFIGDRKKTDLPYVTDPDAKDDWFRAAPRDRAHAGRRRAARRSGIRALRLQRLQAQGRRAARRRRSGSRHRAARAFPQARVTLDPNGGWLLKEAIRLMRDMRGVRGVCRGPVRRRRRLLGPRGDGRVPPRHRACRPPPT